MLTDRVVKILYWLFKKELFVKQTKKQRKTHHKTTYISLFIPIERVQPHILGIYSKWSSKFFKLLSTDVRAGEFCFEFQMYVLSKHIAGKLVKPCMQIIPWIVCVFMDAAVIANCICYRCSLSHASTSAFVNTEVHSSVSGAKWAHPMRFSVSKMLLELFCCCMSMAEYESHAQLVWRPYILSFMRWQLHLNNLVLSKGKKHLVIPPLSFCGCTCTICHSTST